MVPIPPLAETSDSPWEIPPWEIPLADRIQMLRTAPIRVLFFSEVYNETSFRYRVFNICEAINSQNAGISASWFREADGGKILELLEECDLLVVHRPMYRDFYDRLVTKARLLHIPIVCDTDDLVFDPALAPLVIRTLNQHATEWQSSEGTLNDWFGRFARYRLAAQMTDQIWTTNEYLATKAEQSLNKPTAVIPNFLGADQLAISDQIAAIRSETTPLPADFLIGYFSGTPTHQLDFEIASHAIARIMEQYPQVRLRLVGHIGGFDTNLKEFSDRIEVIPFTNYLNLQRLIGEVDLNIAPLQDTDFANCKSELKYFEAAIVGVPTIASPIFTMEQAIADGQTGMLATNIGWYQALKAAIENYPEGLKQMGQKARAQVLATYTPQIQGPAICELITALVGNESRSARRR